MIPELIDATVVYHGSMGECRGHTFKVVRTCTCGPVCRRLAMTGDPERARYVLRSLNHVLSHVRRESFTVAGDG